MKIKNKKAFTIIELLIVVLIIGILAAVALPQYQKAVEKARAVQAIALLRATYTAYETYYLAHGDYPDALKDLDIQSPWTGTTSFASSYSRLRSSNEDWSLEIYTNTNSTMFGLCIGRLNGKYEGTGFCSWKYTDAASLTPGSIYCIERHQNGRVFDAEDGAYCIKIMGGTAVYGKNRTQAFTAYSLP